MTRDKLIHGVIHVYDRQARSDVVDAFKIAGWKPRKRGADTGYDYLSKSECDGDTPRYITSGTEAQVERLIAALDRILQEGGGGFDAYLYG